MNEPKRTRGRPRREGADEEILRAALELLREKGYGELTVDAVAERAGVAKTTLYRRWPSKQALVAAAFAPRIARSEPPPDTGSLAGDATILLREICALKRELNDPELLDVVREAVEPRRALLRDAIARAGRGADSELLADLMVAPILFRDDVDDDLAAAIVKTLRL